MDRGRCTDKKSVWLFAQSEVFQQEWLISTTLPSSTLLAYIYELQAQVCGVAGVDTVGQVVVELVKESGARREVVSVQRQAAQERDDISLCVLDKLVRLTYGGTRRGRRRKE